MDMILGAVIAAASFAAGVLAACKLSHLRDPETYKFEEPGKREKELDSQWDELFKYNGKEV